MSGGMKLLPPLEGYSEPRIDSDSTKDKEDEEGYYFSFFTKSED